VQVNTVKVVLILFAGEVVAAGLKPAKVIVAPTAYGATTFDANVRVAVPARTVKLVAVMLAEIAAEICGVLHT
jgi:hypothetical protein